MRYTMNDVEATNVEANLNRLRDVLQKEVADYERSFVRIQLCFKDASIGILLNWMQNYTRRLSELRACEHLIGQLKR